MKILLINGSPKGKRSNSLRLAEKFIEGIRAETKTIGGEIELTEKGQKKADGIYERHKLLTEFLHRVSGVDPRVAEEDACKMEHIISDATFQGIKEFMKQMGEEP